MSGVMVVDGDATTQQACPGPLLHATDTNLVLGDDGGGDALVEDGQPGRGAEPLVLLDFLGAVGR